MTTIVLMGAAGRMGQRITRNLKDNKNYRTLFVETAEEGIARLEKQGLKVTNQDEALKQADVVILAFAEELIGEISRDIVPKLKCGTMVIGLDSTAALAGVLPNRKDITYFITHPCHPRMFSEEEEPVKDDWVGGYKLKQSIICALHEGPESDYAKGEAIARVIHAPVLMSYRLTTEQMAILEPALAETVCLTCMTIVKEAMDEVIRMGLPRPAVEDFMSGHLRTTIAIVFGYTGFPPSDGARLALEMAKREIIQPDWMKVLKPENVRRSVKELSNA